MKQNIGSFVGLRGATMGGGSITSSPIRNLPRQVKGVYQVKDSNLKGLHKEVMKISKRFHPLRSNPSREKKIPKRIWQPNEAIRRKTARKQEES
jgi:hypothetical protein